MALSETDRILIRLSVGICGGDWELLRTLRRAAPDGQPDRRWREALLQAHLFAGMPRVVEACGVLASVGGLGTPDEDEARHQGDRFAAGHALFERIYAGQAQTVRETLESYHPVLARWIEGHAYGRVLARPGLPPDRRELLAVACLASLGQDRQLASHARGAMFVGAGIEELRDTLATIEDLVEETRLRHAKRVVERFG